MKIKIYMRLFLVIVTSVFWQLQSAIHACGPFFESGPFYHQLEPHQQEAFRGGKLGLFLPQYKRYYLVMAYRSIKGFSPLKIQSQADDRKWLNQWFDLLDEFKIEVKDRYSFEYRSDEDYFSYLNCNEDSFRYSLEVYQKRLRQFGAGSELLKQWLLAQVAVYNNCSGAPTTPVYSMSKLPDILQEDRDYQQAAADFYAGNFPGAIERFSKIIKTGHSEHHEAAEMALARSYFRNFSKTKQKEHLLAANKILIEISRSKQGRYKKAAADYLQFIESRQNPDQVLRKLASVLASKNEVDEKILLDFTFLLNKMEIEPSRNEGELGQEQEILFSKVMKVAEKNDLLLWLYSFQLSGKSVSEFAMEQFLRKGDISWLVIALQKISVEKKIKIDKASLLKITDAAEKISIEHPAYHFVKFHLAKIYLDAENISRARVVLAALEKNSSGLIEMQNWLQVLKLQTAQSLSEFTSSIARQKLIFDTSKTAEAVDKQNSFLIDSDAGKVLTEQISLATGLSLIREKNLRSEIRFEIAKMLFVKAILLKEEMMARTFAIELIKYPENIALKQELESLLENKNPSRLRWILTLLRMPGLRPFVSVGYLRQEIEQIDSLRDNWWCAFPKDSRKDEEYMGGYNYYQIYSTQQSHLHRSFREPLLPFLSPTEKNKGREEFQNLLLLETAPNYLAKEVLAIAALGKTEDYLLLPEALHRIVRATRYGCTQQSGGWSKAAFQFLHKNFPENEWTIKTPYWFNN